MSVLHQWKGDGKEGRQQRGVSLQSDEKSGKGKGKGKKEKYGIAMERLVVPTVPSIRPSSKPKANVQTVERSVIFPMNAGRPILKRLQSGRTRKARVNCQLATLN